MKSELYDIHCHALCGVDDGAKDPEISLKILQKEYKDGVRHLVLTPHYRPGMFEETRERVFAAFQDLTQLAKTRFPELELMTGCEFHICEDIADILPTDPMYRMNGGRYVLTEFSHYTDGSAIRRCVNRILNGGFLPLIAHVERIPALCEDKFELAEQICDMGALLTVNADAVLGLTSREEKKICAQLLKYDMVTMIGSDAHDTEARSPRIGQCYSYVEKKYGSSRAESLFCIHPEKMINGVKI